MRDYFKVTPASYIVFEKAGQILLIKRANTGYYDGSWSLPAGHFEEGETARDVAVREVKEEVGLAIFPGDLVLAHISHRQSPIPQKHERMDLFFKVKNWEGEPINAEPHKHEEIKWFSLKKLPKNMVPEVQNAINNITKGKFYSEFGF